MMVKPISRPLGPGLRAAVALACVAALAPTRAVAEEAAAGAAPDRPKAELRSLDEGPYETPLSGEGFRATVFGRQIEVEPRNRASLTAWSLGFQLNEPRPDDAEFVPTGALFFWRRPDDEDLFRAVTVGVYNEMVYARAVPDLGHMAAFATFNSFTVPVDRSELIDGRSFDQEEMQSGYVRGGVGLGYWTAMPPGLVDNILSLALAFEPDYIYFEEGKKASPNFRAPTSTWEWRTRLFLRYDTIQRNLLELPHRGFATGFDVIYAYRNRWDDWGVNLNHSGHATRDYLVGTAYAVGAGGVPFVDSERHRLLGYLYAGVGEDVDQFSAPRIGGGPHGDELGSLGRPLLPGAAIDEYFSKHYVSFIGEYRYEPIFFIYLSLRASVCFLDRERQRGNGAIVHEDDVVGSVGWRVTSGFFFETEIQLDYNYNWGIVRGDPGITGTGTRYGGHEVVLQVSGAF